MVSKYRNEHPFEQRKKEADQIISKYPDRIPIIVEKNNKCVLEDIDKKKYIVKDELTVGQFLFIIRKRIKIIPEKAIFLFIGNNIPSINTTIRDCYNKYKNEDGMLYVEYLSENTFGSI